MMKTTDAAGREAWKLSNGKIELYVTVKGAHMAPVTFFVDTDSPVEPYYVSPWQEEGGSVPGPGVLNPLRGDIFCLPFGGDNSWGGETHPVHGEVSEAEWGSTEVSDGGGEAFLETSLETKIRSGRVTKRIVIRTEHAALYVSHRIEGFTGPTTVGHHAIMRGDRTHHLSCPKLITGITDTAPPPPSSREYASMPPGAFFDDFSAVPTIWKNPAVTDCTVFPAREGFVDIIQIFPEVPPEGEPLWFTAVVPSHGYLWYSLKNPAVLPSTVLWQENRGRHGAPWSGRNCCLGIEEVLGHLASGLGVSAKDNALTERGLRTCMELDGKAPFEVRNIQGVCRIPEGFEKVSTARFEEGAVSFADGAGRTAQAAVDWSFVLD